MNSPAFFTVFCAIIVKDKFKGGSSMKKILLIVMMLVMCVSSACFASDGSVLDAEAKMVDQFLAKMVDQFLNASSYKNVSSILSDDMKANFDETKFNEYKASITKDLGAFKEKQLVNVIKRPGVDRLVYGAGFDGGKVMMVIADFAVNNEKPLLLNIAIVPPQPPQDQAQADQNK